METLRGSNYLDVNRRLWNAKTEHHVRSGFYDMPGFLAKPNSLVGPEVDLLGDLDGKTLLHLQCHFGQDTISLAKLGARVTGLDLSDAAIREARALAIETGTDARFVCADVYDAAAVLGEKYDVVFATYGTIGWLPDVGRWAQVVADCLRPGGRLIFAEFHPTLWMYSDDFSAIQYSYFNRGALIETPKGTYADREAAIELEEISWNHSLSEVIGALLAAGMNITHFQEYDYSPYDCFQQTVEIAPRRFMIKGLEGKLPMMYTLTAGLAAF